MHAAKWKEPTRAALGEHGSNGGLYSLLCWTVSCSMHITGMWGCRQQSAASSHLDEIKSPKTHCLAITSALLYRLEMLQISCFESARQGPRHFDEAALQHSEAASGLEEERKMAKSNDGR